MKDADENDYFDKSIAGYTIESISEKSVNIQVTFGEYNDITTEIIDPDIL